MRILHLIPNLSAGGAERQLSYLAPELARMGHDVHIAYSEEGIHRPELPGVVLHRLKVRSNYDPYLIWQLVRLTRRIKPDIIHTWILQMDILGGMGAKLHRIPWVIHEQSSAMAYPPTWKHRLRIQLGSGANAIVSNSLGGDEYWKVKLPSKRRYVVPNGLPGDEIDMIVAGLPPGMNEPEAPIVLYAGRLTSDRSASKNMNTLLEALACVRQQQTVLGIFCGDGPQRYELEVLRHKLGLDADVHFTGYLPVASVWALMKKASAFVSLREILDEKSAYFVDPSNMHHTVETILEALCNTESSKGRALSAKQKSQDWSISEMGRNWENVYKELI
jgi:glycosyltransferase involved in cell wall biosynthesis